METPTPNPNPAPGPTSTPGPTPTPTATPGPSPLAGADGVLAANWLQHEKIDPTLRTDKTLATIKDVPTLAAMLVNAEKAIGKKRAVVPTDPANKPEVDEFFALAGWPKDGPEKYPEVPLPANLPAEIRDNPQHAEARKAEMTAWRQLAHKWHLTEEQFLGLSKEIQEREVAAYQAAQAQAVKDQADRKIALQNEWQGKYDYNVQLANTAAAAFCNANDLAYARSAGWLGDPVFLKLFKAIGEAVSPDRLHAGSTGRADTGSIERQIFDLETSEAYRKPDNPRHDAVTQQVLQLREQLRAARQP